MSLLRMSYQNQSHSFPRVSGDEPTASLVVPQITWFSPRERG